MLIKGLVVVVCCLLFWLMCYRKTGTDEKNMISFRSYPKAVQERVSKDAKLSALVPKEVSLGKVFVANVVLFTIVFLIIGVALKYTVGFDSFLAAFLYLLILGEVINLFDLLVIDLLWWRNTTRIRFRCAPEKELYQDIKKHIDSSFRGIIMFAIPAVIVAGILQLLP